MSEQMNEKCHWNEDEDGIWWACHPNAFVFNEEGPTQHKFKFCPFCSKPLVPVEFVEPELEDED